ncbi:MAG: glutamate 5-kinase [Chloroflexota bacterium]
MDRKSGSLSYRRIVAKFGTGLLTGGSNQLDLNIMSSLVNQVAYLQHQGGEIVIVSSGAIAAGRHKLGLTRKIKGIPYKQVLASVGQSRLMNVYEQLFSRHDIAVAQALLTKADLSDRAGYLNARNTLLALMELKVVGIVNENDVVAVDELHEAKFGDNDNLSAMVANLVDADLLLILSDIAGLYTADPHRHPDARLIPEVNSITSEVEKMVGDTAGNLGTGGMITKVEAAKLATACGVTVVIADGREPDVITRTAAGEKIGTHFLPASSNLESRQRWMLSGLGTRGKLIVDSGAALALKKQNRSLLAAGIIEIEGDFQRGDIVDIYDIDGSRLGCGITNYSSADIAAIKGTQSRNIAQLLGYDFGSEVVHRNNLVVL